jgi:hypothetical protein
MNPTQNQAVEARYALSFHSLRADRVFSFPCDEAGHVDLDSLSDTARLNYFYARTVIGREFSRPAIERLH